jgi:hypothetical protein
VGGHIPAEAEGSPAEGEGNLVVGEDTALAGVGIGPGVAGTASVTSQ